MEMTSFENKLSRLSAGPVAMTVPVSLFAGHGAGGQCRLESHWVAGRSLAVHCRGNKDQHMTAESQGCVLEIQWESSNWNRVTRKFVNQTHGYFMSLQSCSREGEGLEPSDLVRYNRLYRSALHECVDGLRKMATDDDGDENYSDQVTLYSMLELVWHLCEVLFIEVLPAGCLVQQLLEWVQWHSDGKRDKLLSTIVVSPSPEEHPQFWSCLYELILKGRLSEARDLLSHHSLSHTLPQVHSSMDELLRKAPMILSTASLSRAELQRRWNEWRSEVVRRRGAGEFASVPELDLLAQILCGEDEVFGCEQVVSCCGNWYELMVGKLLFTLPLVVSGDYDLIYAAEGAIKVFQRDRGAIDDILLAALHNDIMELIQLSSSLFNTWWLVAHLAHMLDYKGLVPKPEDEFKPSLPEFFLLEYASSLAAHPSLWQVAMGYLSECPKEGRRYMEGYVERIPVESEKKACKLLRVCEKYQLREQAQSVCRVQAMRACKTGRLGVALSWCIRGKDSSFAAYLAEKYMDSYKVEGDFMDLDLLDHLGDAILLNERLMFLAKYREYHQLYETGECVAAGKLLVSLLLSNTVPTRFWSTLLTDALALMENEKVVFSSEQTYALSHLVQQLTLSSDNSHQSESVSTVVTKETFSLLHLALARNLSRAILDENSL